ncbi:hypothetical protein [Streptomyces showdoensis]|uniref:Uncharacterized protein n=1 Tax=Streptomyces showdoensis TaxID=68268 RepID=A0A2P2GKI4_STREW|nr:hypothetical protein [Streptomyces showdoensis]KKZ72018.1 hypothetical protein VO63_20785 [Streptomyces showdoensis]
MAAHAAVPARRQLSTHGWGVPVTLGIAYGLYAPVIVRDGGPLTWGQLWLGLISAVVLAVSIHTLRRYGGRLRRELRAVAWGALTGIAIGFLYSLSGASIYSSSLLGLIVAAVNGGAAFYLFYTHEDAAGRPAPY